METANDGVVEATKGQIPRGVSLSDMIILGDYYAEHLRWNRVVVIDSGSRDHRKISCVIKLARERMGRVIPLNLPGYRKGAYLWKSVPLTCH